MKLLENIKLNSTLELKNRIVMAPMTRSRAYNKGMASDIMITYYEQRASAGLIISEAINISESAIGSPFTPGIYTREQIESWKKVTEAVHNKNGKIFAQLWHTGRVGHSTDRNGKLPVAPSAIGIKGQQHFTSQGFKEYETPQALTLEEIKQTIADYGQAAKNAIEAGFDGVELHSAFGYLPGQFLAESSNLRTDEYGGSIKNRSRFVLEVIDEIINQIGADKTGIRLSPSIIYNNVENSNPIELYTYLITELNNRNLVYLHLMQPLMPIDNFPQYPKDTLSAFQGLFSNTIIGNGGYTKELAEETVSNKKADLISFGSPFITNPDLPIRFKLNATLNPSPEDKSSFYGGDSKGYIDYPSLESINA